MTPSQNIINFIKSHEGLRLRAYLDSANIPTVGYGCTLYKSGTRVKMGDIITKEQAESELAWQIELKAQGLRRLVAGINLSQNQFDALVSLTYNIGLGAFAKSTLLKLIKQNVRHQGIEAAWLAWDKVTKNGVKVVEPGLAARRRDEFLLFSS